MDQKFKKKKQGKFDSEKKRKFNEGQDATNGNLQEKQKPVVPKKPKISTTEEDLPRGAQKQQSVAPTERATAHNDNDILFGKKPQQGIKKRKKVKKQQTEEMEEEEPLDPVAQQLLTPEDVSTIQASQLRPGVCLLGVIRELTETVAFVDLPCEVGGAISLDQTSDIIAEALQKPKPPRIEMVKIYHIGQVVRCVVVSNTKVEKINATGQKKISDRVILSTRGSLVNQSVAFDLQNDFIRQGTLLTGCIKSVEDHGYVIDFGGRELNQTGFLRKENATKYMEQRSIKQFLVGQPIDCIVDSVQSTSSSRTIQVTLDPEILSTTELDNEDESLTHESLPVGALVKAQVNGILNQGLHVIFLQYFGGTIHTRHLDLAPILNHLTKNGSIGNSPLNAFKKKTLDARIVYVDRRSKRVLLSAAPHIRQYSHLPQGLSVTVGQVVHQPLLLQKMGPAMMLAFKNDHMKDHPWNISLVFPSKRGKMTDEQYDDLSVGQLLSFDCHTTSLDYFEGHFRGKLIDAKKQKAAGLAFKDIAPGSFVNCIIQKVDPQLGLLVGVEGGVPDSYPFKALIPLHHVSDLPPSNLKALFHTGKKLRCRVVSKDEKMGRLILTNKKTLLETDLPIITEYQVKPGTVAHGVVSDIDEEHGVAVQFYNNTFGIIPIMEINELYPEHVSTVFSFGQPVKVKVLRSGARSGDKKGSQALALTIKLGSEDDAALEIDEEVEVQNVDQEDVNEVQLEEEEQQNNEEENDNENKEEDNENEPEPLEVEEADDDAFEALEVEEENEEDKASPALHKKNKPNPFGAIQVGSIVSGTVKAFLTSSHLSGILPAYNNKHIKIGVAVELSGGVFGYLLDYHNSDCAAHYKALRPSLNTTINELLVVEKLEKHNIVFLSMKPCLLAASKAKAIKSLADLKENTQVWGYVTSAGENKLQVNFVPNFQGTVHSHYIDLGKKRPQTLSKFFAVGQSLRMTVASVTQAKKKTEQPTIELALKLTTENISWVSNYFREEELIYERTMQKKKSPFEQLTYGGVVNVAVQSSKAFGTTFSIPQLKDSNVSAFALDYHIPKPSDDDSDDEEESGTVARVLDIDKNGGVVDVSLRKDILKDHDKPYSAAVESLRESFYLQYNLSMQEVFWATSKHTAIRSIGRIELVKTHYLVVSIAAHNTRLIVYVATKDYNDVRDPSKMYRIGENVEVWIPNVPSNPEQRILGAIPHMYTRPQKVAPPSLDTTSLRIADDSKLQILNDVTPGLVLRVTVKRILKELILVQVGSHITGTIHCTQIVDEIPSQDLDYLKTFPYNLATEAPSKKALLQNFQEGQTLIARVIGIVDGALLHKFLPVTHQQLAKTNILELTIKPSEVTSSTAPTSLQFTEIKRGNEYIGVVAEVSRDKLKVDLSRTVSGTISFTHISSDLDILNNFENLFQPGQPIPVKVVTTQPLAFTLNYPGFPTSAPDTDVKPGNIVIGRIFHKEVEHSRMFVKLSSSTVGIVHATDVDDVYHNKPIHRFLADAIVRCYIIEGPIQDKTLTLKQKAYRVSLRQSLVDPSFKDRLGSIQTAPTYQPVISELSDIKPGSTIHGFCGPAAQGVVPVEISRNPAIKAVIPLSQRASHAFFHLGRLLTAQVVKIEKSTVTLALSKETTAKLQTQSAATAKEAESGNQEKVKIEVVPREYKNFTPNPNTLNVAEDRVFRRLKLGSAVKGLVIGKSSHSVYALADKSIQRNLVLECEIPDINELHSIQLGQKINLCLISKDFTRKAFNFRLVSDSQPITKSPAQPEKAKPVQEEEPAEEDAMEEEAYEAQTPVATTKPKSNTNMSVGLEWDDFKLGKAKAQTSEEADEMEIEEDQLELDDNEDSITNKKASKKHKALQKEIKEQLISKKEAEASEGAPQTAMDYERLVLGSPNNSFLWIKFMAFHLSMAEIDKARQIAERALKTISFREEKEKLNVYVAWMNLENLYGSQDSLLKVFNQALLYSEPKDVYFRLLEIYSSSKNVEQEEALLKTMIRKFKDSGKVWEHYAVFLINNKSLDDFRNMIPNCINALPKRKHIPMISKFAQMEFKYGSADRGRTIFEGIVANYPKRIDIWNIYLDMEIKAGDLPTIRRLFDRLTSLSVSTKKMKFFFKKYLNFEKQYGDPESVERVKQKAVEYVESKSH